LLAMTEKEEARSQQAATNIGALLRKLAARHVFTNLAMRPGPLGLLRTRNIGFAVQRLMAKKFKGNPEKMRRDTTASLRGSAS